MEPKTPARRQFKVGERVKITLGPPRYGTIVRRSPGQGVIVRRSPNQGVVVRLDGGGTCVAHEQNLEPAGGQVDPTPQYVIMNRHGVIQRTDGLHRIKAYKEHEESLGVDTSGWVLYERVKW